MSIVEPDPADGADEYLRSQNWRTEPAPQGGAYDHVASAVHLQWWSTSQTCFHRTGFRRH